MVQPVEGMEEIANPFLEDDEEEIEVEGWRVNASRLSLSHHVRECCAQWRGVLVNII